MDHDPDRKLPKWYAKLNHVRPKGVPLTRAQELAMIAEYEQKKGGIPRYSIADQQDDRHLQMFLDAQTKRSAQIGHRRGKRGAWPSQSQSDTPATEPSDQSQ